MIQDSEKVMERYEEIVLGLMERIEELEKSDDRVYLNVEPGQFFGGAVS
jgi:hypothetical protein